MTQKNENQLSDYQLEIASKALADSVVALAGREDIEKEATSIAKALVAGLQVIQASCSTR